jgi:integrase/recombinase XerD
MLLKFAIQEFHDDRQFKNVAKQTKETYNILLNQFLEYCNENEIVNVEDITPNIIKKYIITQQKKGNKPTTTNTKLQRIKAFLNYMVEIEVLTKSPADKISRAKEDIKIEVFTDYHIKQMLNYYRRTRRRENAFWAYRDYTLILTMLGTGIRLTESTNLKWSDVDFKNQTLTIFGKNRKLESVPVTEKLLKELSAYKVYCEQLFGEYTTYVFTDKDGKQLTANAIKCIFKRLSSVMNFKDVEFQHILSDTRFVNAVLCRECQLLQFKTHEAFLNCCY